MPSMLRMNSYDTICHEHLEYYALARSSACSSVRAQHHRRPDERGERRQLRGDRGEGGLAVPGQHHGGVSGCWSRKTAWGFTPRGPSAQFEERVFDHRADLQRLIRALNADGKRIVGYGASTKGNVLLQFCGFSEKDIPAIAEVNPEKFGRFTPGTGIPIVSEAEATAMKPDYFLVLPWHFKSNIIAREQEFLASGGRMIFPLPEIEIVGG